MDELLNEILVKIEERFKLEPLKLPKELAETSFPLKLIEMKCFNWTAANIKKIYAMRMKVKIPLLDILGMAIYPADKLDAPVFSFDLSCTKKKVVSYINPIIMSDRKGYYEKYIRPFKSVRHKYIEFPPQKSPDWMKQYHSDVTVYSMPETVMLNDLKLCVKEYLDIYLPILENADEITDSSYLNEIKTNFQKYRNDLLTKDRSQKMLGKLIGKNKSHRIFHEVLV